MTGRMNILLVPLALVFMTTPAMANWVSLEQGQQEATADAPSYQPTQSNHLQLSQLAKTKSDFDPNLAVSLYGRGISDETEQTRVAGTVIRGGFQYHYDEIFMTKVELLLVGESGSTHALLDQNQPHNGIYVDEVSAEVRPFSFFALEGGDLNQRALANPLLVDEVAFPAVREKILLSTHGPYQVSLQAEQAIPTSVSASTMTSNQEPLPLFQTQTVNADINTDQVKIGFVGGHFEFQDLPSEVALQSVNFGNSVDATVPTNAHFLNTYSGWTTSAFVEPHLFEKFSPRVGGAYLVNTAAPSSDNMGYSAFGQMTIRLSSAWSITPKYEWFENERDSSPAFYNSVLYAHNNRQGYLAEFKLANTTRGVALKGQYVDSRILEEDPIQVNTQFFYLGLELSHVPF